MHVHRPKLVHGLGEFLKEYGIIVLGVLTALALEQAVESWRSHETLTLIRASLGQELAEDRGRWEFLRRQDNCMTQRAESVIAWTRNGASGAAHEDLSGVFIPSVHASAWELARSNPAFTHMPIREQMAYSSLYDALTNQQHYLYEEQQRWNEIYASQKISDDPVQRGYLARALSAALGYQKRRQLSYAYVFRRFDELNIRPDASFLADIKSSPCGA
jgi:hypothetical protein